MRRSTTLVTLSMALTFTLMGSADAGGGGNVLELDRYYYAVGTSETHSEQVVSFRTARAARHAIDQDWGLHLTREPEDWNHIELAPTDPRVGTIRFEPGSRARIALASFELAVPSLTPGGYLIVLCNQEGCTNSVGDLYTSGIQVVESATDALMIERLEHLRGRQSELRYRFRRLSRTVDGLEDDVAEGAAEIQLLTDDRDRLRARLRRLEAVEPTRSSALPWSVAAILFTLLVVGIVRYLRPTSRWERYFEPDDDTEPGHLEPPKEDPTLITKAYVETFDDSMWQRPKEPSDPR